MQALCRGSRRAACIPAVSKCRVETLPCSHSLPDAFVEKRVLADNCGRYNIFENVDIHVAANSASCGSVIACNLEKTNFCVVLFSRMSMAFAVTHHIRHKVNVERLRLYYFHISSLLLCAD
jgi:hypothetical protein